MYVTGISLKISERLVRYEIARCSGARTQWQNVCTILITLTRPLAIKSSSAYSNLVKWRIFRVPQIVLPALPSVQLRN